MAIEKIIKIEGANIPFTCKQIAKMVGQKKISFDNIVQRSYVWENKRRSEFIWSIIMGYPIPPVYAKRGAMENNIKTYDILDGQQRNTTIYKFINDEFALSELKSIPCIDENGNEFTVDISGKKFSELDEELQDAICDRTINVYYYDSIEQAEEAEMFRRLNNGKPLSAKSRTLASCGDIEKILDIGSHKIFDSMLTEKARANKNQAVVVMKVWSMLNMEIYDVSFESKIFNPILENTMVLPDEEKEINSVFDYMFEVHEWLIGNKENKIAKKMFTETHFVSLIPFVKLAIDNNIDESLFAEWLVSFYKTSDKKISKYDLYNDACSSGSAKSSSIVDRNDCLTESYNDFFKEDNNEDNEEDNEEEEEEEEEEE